MQSAGSTPSVPMQKWTFAVEIGGFDAAFFTKASGLTAKNQVSVFAPAGSLFDQKTPGRMAFDDVVLEKGKAQVGTDNMIMQWLADIADVTSGVGKIGTALRNVDIVEYDREGNEINRYRLYNAFITDAKMGDWDGSSSEPLIQSLTLSYQYFDTV